MSLHALVFDVEAVAIDGASDYLEPASAPANYKDEAKIAAYIEQANRDALDRAALDIDLARIVALGFMGGSGTEPMVGLVRDEQDEIDALKEFWSMVTPKGTNRPTLIGFNCIGYDLPLLLRRSLYLGLTAPRFQMGKYRHDGIEDLMLALSFDGSQKYRGLAFYAKRFGLEIPDETTGKDIAALVEAENWAGVKAHCRADVLRTAALARRVGLLDEASELAEVG